MSVSNYIYTLLHYIAWENCIIPFKLQCEQSELCNFHEQNNLHYGTFSMSVDPQFFIDELMLMLFDFASSV